MSPLDQYSQNSKEDFISLFVGRQIAEGTTREVFTHALDPTLVIKMETRRNAFNNVREWEFWKDASKHPKWAKWLAPCVAISNYGCVLIQKRTERLITKFPKRIPAFLADVKIENFGLYEGRVVCHDYGANDANELLLTNCGWIDTADVIHSGQSIRGG